MPEYNFTERDEYIIITIMKAMIIMINNNVSLSKRVMMTGGGMNGNIY